MTTPRNPDPLPPRGGFDSGKTMVTATLDASSEHEPDVVLQALKSFLPEGYKLSDAVTYFAPVPDSEDSVEDGWEGRAKRVIAFHPIEPVQ